MCTRILLPERHRKPLHNPIPIKHAHLWPDVLPVGKDQTCGIPPRRPERLLPRRCRSWFLQSRARAPAEAAISQSSRDLAFLLWTGVVDAVVGLAIYPPARKVLEML